MLIPFKKEHLEVMDMREHERNVLALSPLTGELLEQATVSRTAIIDGRVIACGGVTKNLYGSGDAWLIPSIYLPKYRVTYLRLVLDWLDNVSEAFEIKRMQTACLNDDLHDNYMEYLGFAKEGVMRQYALGKDYSVWGRLWA
jgi:hypothetical protein